jgi:hypothetical protein
VRMGVLRQFTSVFTETGDNMNLKPNAIREKAEKLKMTPAWIRKFSPALIALHRLRMIARGTYVQKPFDYAPYTFASPSQRATRHVAQPTGRWRGRG